MHTSLHQRNIWELEELECQALKLVTRKRDSKLPSPIRIIMESCFQLRNRVPRTVLFAAATPPFVHPAHLSSRPKDARLCEEDLIIFFTRAEASDHQNTMPPCYGQSSACKPVDFPLAKNGKISWSWCPTFSWLKQLLILIIFIGAAGVALIILAGIGFIFMPSQFIVGIVLFILGFVMTPVMLNWKYNADRFMAIKIARGKSVQAMELWERVDDMFLYQAKDTFFQTRYGGKTLRVLRDGTIEIEGTHRDMIVGSGDITKVDMGAAVEASATAATYDY